MVHPSSIGASWNKKAKDENDFHHAPGKTRSSYKNGPESRSLKPVMAPAESDLSNMSYGRDDWASSKENVSNLQRKVTRL